MYQLWSKRFRLLYVCYNKYTDITGPIKSNHSALIELENFIEQQGAYICYQYHSLSILLVSVGRGGWDVTLLRMSFCNSY